MADNASKQQRVERWAWILLYSGLLTLVLGLFLPRYDPALARAIQIGGAVLAAGGAALIWVRSRM